MGADRPDVSLLEGVVSERVLAAMRAASGRLKAAGVTHALAGALAVGAHGYPRAGKDVNFVVGPEAFTIHGGGVVTINPEVPIRVGDVVVDPLSVGPDEPWLLEAVRKAPLSQGIPVLPLEALVSMKLKSPREKDRVDVIELVKAGIATGPVREWLGKHAPGPARRFEEAVEQARRESEAG
jgi:hypothetical protein